MSERKWPKAPWSWQWSSPTDKREDDRRIALVGRDGLDVIVATRDSDSSWFDVQSDQVAALLEAAPALYEALERVMRFGHHAECMSHRVETTPCNCGYETGEAALKAARGEQ